MFIGYNLKISKQEEESCFDSISGKRHPNCVAARLEEYLNCGGYLDGGKIQEDYFPSVESDVLISHSHDDILLARKIANIVEEVGLKVFLDEEYWGSCDAFLRKIDNRYCRNEYERTYSYKKRNFSTSVMHMLLSTALAHVIQKAECVIFLNTRNTVLSHEYGKDAQTGSPWIYHELCMTKMLAPSERNMGKRKKKRKTIVASKQEAILEALKVNLPIPTEHLETLSLPDFFEWIDFCNSMGYTSGDALDALYQREFQAC